jgi:hypothetical protein
VREIKIEEYLSKKTKELKGISYKTLSPGHSGFPDRFVALPFGIGAHVETKAPGKKSTVLQKARQLEIKTLGHRVYTDIDSYEKVDKLLAELWEEAKRKMVGI